LGICKPNRGFWNPWSNEIESHNKSITLIRLNKKPQRKCEKVWGIWFMIWRCNLERRAFNFFSKAKTICWWVLWRIKWVNLSSKWMQVLWHEKCKFNLIFRMFLMKRFSKKHSQEENQFYQFTIWQISLSFLVRIWSQWCLMILL